MHIPRFVRHVNRVFTNPIFRMFAWLVPPLAIVGHVGRRSGRAYRTPVVAFRGDRHVVIPLTYGRDVDWARNLVAGGGDLEQIGRRFHMRNARIVDGAAAAPHLPPLVRQALLAASLPGFVLLDL